MPYNVYFKCCRCGRDGFTCTDRTVSYETMLTVANQSGWRLGAGGWVCPECQGKEKNNGQV